MIICGIDNGATGQIGIIYKDGSYDVIDTPSERVLSYQKSKTTFVNRVIHKDFKKYLSDILIKNPDEEMKVFLERPMVNKMRFNSSLNAMRSYESEIIALESLNLSYDIIDSKKWQKSLLPVGVSGSVELKKASMDVGIRLFPKSKAVIKKHKDADGILIAEFARMNLYKDTTNNL